MFLQNNGNRIKCYQNAIKATYDARKSQCLCGFPGSLSLFVLDTGGTLLNVYQLSFVCFQPVFSLSYTVSLPFLIFCCQFVARNQITSTFFSCTCSVVILVHFPPRNQSIVVDFLFYVSRLYDQFRIDHPGLFPQTTQYNLFQVTYMVIYPAIFLAR